jgi:hypothetical protein
VPEERKPNSWPRTAGEVGERFSEPLPRNTQDRRDGDQYPAAQVHVFNLFGVNSVTRRMTELLELLAADA